VSALTVPLFTNSTSIDELPVPAVLRMTPVDVFVITVTPALFTPLLVMRASVVNSKVPEFVNDAPMPNPHTWLVFSENVTVPAFDSARVMPPFDAPDNMSEPPDATAVAPDPDMLPVPVHVPAPVSVTVPLPARLPPDNVSVATDIDWFSLNVPAEIANELTDWLPVPIWFTVAPVAETAPVSVEPVARVYVPEPNATFVYEPVEPTPPVPSPPYRLIVPVSALNVPLFANKTSIDELPVPAVLRMTPVDVFVITVTPALFTPLLVMRASVVNSKVPEFVNDAPGPNCHVWLAFTANVTVPEFDNVRARVSADAPDSVNDPVEPTVVVPEPDMLAPPVHVPAPVSVTVPLPDRVPPDKVKVPTDSDWFSLNVPAEIANELIVWLPLPVWFTVAPLPVITPPSVEPVASVYVPLPKLTFVYEPVEPVPPVPSPLYRPIEPVSALTIPLFANKTSIDELPVPAVLRITPVEVFVMTVTPALFAPLLVIRASVVKSKVPEFVNEAPTPKPHT
jgi:hypothetical protein